MKFTKNKIILFSIALIILLNIILAKNKSKSKSKSKSLKCKKALYRNTHKNSHKNSNKNSHRNSHKKSHHKKQVHIVQDTSGFAADLHTVVRRNPSVTAMTRMGSHRLSMPSSSNYFSNSNTSTLPNVGFLGHTAEIVNPHIVVHSKSPISVVKETPAQVGWRNEQKTITSLNLQTGQPESNTLNNRVPIYGNIEEVKTVYRNDGRSYDIYRKQFGPIRTEIPPQ